VRFAVSGSHGTGKSTLIAAFLAKFPGYRHEPEAFEALADDVELTSSEGPTPDGLEALLDHTIAMLAGHPPGSSVVFERSPVDYVAYAAASRSWPAGAVERFLEGSLPDVRAAVRHLDLIVLLPVSSQGPPPRADDDPRFRKRVDLALRRALIDDDHDLFGRPDAPRVVELAPSPERQLAELVQLVSQLEGGR